MSPRTVYCIGNPALPSDATALQLADTLKVRGFTFVKVTSPEEIFAENKDELIIMDVAKSIDRVTVLTDLSALKSRKMISLHDFDLAFFLQLMEKMGTLPKTVILIALPMGKGEEELMKEVWWVMRKL